MAGVSYCDGETEKQPAAGPVRRLWQLCSIKWFINAARAERGTARQRRKRERKRERQRASLSSHYHGCAAEHTHQHAPFLPLSLLSHFLTHTHTRLVTQTQAQARRGAEAVQCAAALSITPSPGCLSSPLIRAGHSVFYSRQSQTILSINPSSHVLHHNRR